jgi:hypothetical protein
MAHAPITSRPRQTVTRKPPTHVAAPQTQGTTISSTPHLGNAAAPGFTSAPASAAAGPSAPPIDPAFEAYRAAAGRNVAVSDAEAKYQLGSLSNEYGIGDTSNPYSKAALLQESYNRSKLGTTNSMASQGQLYSGALQNAQGENDRNYSINSDALKRAYGNATHAVRYGQAQTYANNAIGVDSSAFQSLLNSLGA